MSDGQRCYEAYQRSINDGKVETLSGWGALPEYKRQAWDAVAAEMKGKS